MRYALNPNQTEAAEAKQRDFDCYFSSYAYLYHQKEMLQDMQRMDAYHGAIMGIQDHIQGKKVLDIGAGTGILSIWAKIAGAQKVWAVEFTDMAKYAKKLCKANDPDGVISVLQQSAEEVILDSRVDIIVSEWMGMFLLRESMLDSLIRVRDRLLKPDGLMMPSHATMYWGLTSNEYEYDKLKSEMDEATQAWRPFIDQIADKYGVKLHALSSDYAQEQKEYYIHHSRWVSLGSEDVVCPGVPVKHINVKTVTLKQAKGVEPTPFRFEATKDANVTGFLGWFDTTFRVDSTDTDPVVLSTSPKAGPTHWGQQFFPFEKTLFLKKGDIIEGTMEMFRSNFTQRTYKVRATWKLLGVDATTPTKSALWHIE
uniref:Methyltransferase domain-containing protein n=1 Tax=Lotharella globosa TaxID=91324 RepID=A0A7S3ZIM8_9EUKA